MSTPAPFLRPLAVFAFALGVLDVALLLHWWLREPAPPVEAASDAAAEPSDARSPLAAAAPVRSDPAEAPTEPAPADAESTETASAVLYGSLARSDGTPVARGSLWLHRDGRQVDSASLDNGVYAFAGLQPGDYSIGSRVDDALPLRRTVHVDAPRTRLDLRLEPSWVLAVHAVTPDGQPFPEALDKADPRFAQLRSLVAAAFAEPLQGDLPLSDLAEVEVGIGAFRGDTPFRGGAAPAKKTVGVLTLPPGAPVHVALLLRSAVVAQQLVAADQPEVTFTVDPAQLLLRTAKVSLRVVDENGTPVPDCLVALNDRQTGGGGDKTGADGRVVFERLVPGRLRLQIMHKAFRGPPWVVDVSPGADLDLGDVTVRPYVEVAFVGDFGGEGTVRLTWLDAPQRPGCAVADSYLSAQNGATLRGGLHPGRYAALATSKGAGALFLLDTAALPPLPIRIDLRPGAQLRIRGGRDGQSVDVEVRAGNGAICRQRRYRGPIDYADTLPLGSYVVTITDNHGVATQRTIVLSRDGAVVDLQ